MGPKNGETIWVIGGERDCDLVVDLPAVSRHHCRLTRKPDGSFTLVDLGSTNGTFVNGRRLLAEVPVRPSDVISLGLTVLMPWPDRSAIETPQPPARIIRVGREPDNDLVLDRPEVSGHHARVLIENGGQTGFVEDLGSTNGTSVNVLNPQVARAVITPADVVYFGPVAVNAATFFSAQPVAPCPVVPELVFQGEAMTLGRDPSCDRVLESPVVSSRHARIVRDGRAFRIEDLGSSNGTFVNGRRIDRSATIKAADLIGLGDYEIRFVDGSPRVAKVKSQWPLTSFEAEAVGLILPHFLQAVALPALAYRVFGVTAPAAWLCVALIVFWFGLTMELFERFWMAARLDPPSPLVLQSYTRVPAFDLLGSFLVVLGAMNWTKLSLDLRAIGILWLTALIGSAVGKVLARLTGRWWVSLAVAGWMVVMMGMLSSPAWTLPSFGPVGRVVAEVIPTRWAFEGLLDLTAGNQAIDPANDPVERFYPAETDRTGPLACTVALLAMLIGLISLDAIMARSGLDRSCRAAPVSH